MAEPFSYVLFEVIWQGLVEGIAYEIFEEGWEGFINESKKNKQVNIDLTVALEKCFYLSQKTIAQRCLQELKKKSTWTQYRGVKTYNPPENDVDIKKLEKKIESLEKQLKQVDNQKPDNQSVISTNKVQKLLTQLSLSNSQSSQETKEDIDKIFEEAEKDCNVSIYKNELRNEENGLVKSIFNSFVREIEHNERLNRIFSAQKLSNIDSTTTKIDITTQEILKEIQKISKEVQDTCNKASSDSIIADTITSKRRQLKKLRELLNNLEEKEIEYGLIPIVEIRENKGQINKRTGEIHQEIQDELKYRSPLPPQRFLHFVGRQNDFNNIFNTLKDFNNNSNIIAIDGIGGVGKTALTRQIVNNLQNAGFYSVVWESAKPEEFSGGVAKTVNNANINFEGLLTQIGSKLGYVEVHNIRSLEDKRKFVHEILGEERYLVVIDNLETLEGYRELVNNLEDLFTSSKAILTTRHLISGVRHVKPFSLEGFEENESCEFLKIYASERPRANETISAVNQEKLAEIHKLTGGIPLAMELVVGQLEQGSSLRRVIKELKSVNYGVIQNRESDENIYKQFYKFIYLNSWEELSDEEQDLLICIGEFDLSEGAKIDDLIDIAELKAAQVEDITAKLIQLSLVKRHGIEDEQTFFLHPLTHLFVQQQLEEE